MRSIVGNIYHIKDEFFDLVKDNGLILIMKMVNVDQHILH